MHQPDSVLDNMNQWSAKVHAKSGLTQKCKDSKISLEEAEIQVCHPFQIMYGFSLEKNCQCVICFWHQLGRLELLQSH